MAGHSHWANIAHKKGRIDKVRGKLFGRLSKAIIVAAKHGGGDPAANLALRYAIDAARKSSMPNDTIERAVKKGSGELEAENYEEVLYEGYGPGGVAIMCEILTENRNRTAGDVRRIFDHGNGNLGSTNCVSWMFERKGLFAVPADQIAEDELMDLVLEAGASDFEKSGDVYEVTCPPDQFSAVGEAIEARKLSPSVAQITLLPNTRVSLDLETSRSVLKLLDALNDYDDIQNVVTNFDMSEEVMAELSA